MRNQPANPSTIITIIIRIQGFINPLRRDELFNQAFGCALTGNESAVFDLLGQKLNIRGHCSAWPGPMLRGQGDCTTGFRAIAQDRTRRWHQPGGINAQGVGPRENQSWRQGINTKGSGQSMPKACGNICTTMVYMIVNHRRTRRSFKGASAIDRIAICRSTARLWGDFAMGVLR
jgi:hypothetical protein